MPESHVIKRPKRKARDVVHTLVKAGIAGVPCLGGPANELLSLVITPSLDRRREEWIDSIGKGLKALQVKVEGFKIENLREFEAKYPRNPSRGVRIEFVAKSNEKTVITAQKAFPGLANRENFYDQVLKDLRVRGLLEVRMTDGARFLQKIVYAQPTNLGKQLLAFISSPLASHRQADNGG